MAIGTVEIVLGVILLILFVYYKLTNIYKFWKQRGVIGPKPVALLGTVKDVISGKYSIASYMDVLYKQYPDETMIGFYMPQEPVLMLTDLDLMKKILITDFRSFVDRGLKVHEKHEPLTNHLFQVDEKTWRPLRTKLSPVFTSGKLKDMFYLLLDCAEKLDKYVENLDDQVVDMREIAAKFTTDVIGVCAFGLQANALEDEGSLFREMGKRIFSSNWKSTFRFRLRNFMPGLYNLIGGFLKDPILNDFFINLTRDTIEYRKKNNVKRNDFVDLLAVLRDENKKLDDIELTDSLMAAQLFVFFVAGFETSSSTISNCLYELAKNQPVQDKLRNEIKRELSKNNGKITYESIKGMQYLDQVLNETLRIYPSVTSIMRRTTTPYTFPGTQVTIPAGINVWMPIFSIQRDPKYFPKPDVFDPDRFSAEEIAQRHPMTFLPFGDGPRNCIGMRFGKMQTKVGLVTLLNKYSFDICDETDMEYIINERSFLLVPIHGIKLKIKRD